MALTKEQMINCLNADGEYFMRFTTDRAVDYFYAEHRKMKKAELQRLLDEEKESSEYIADAVKQAEREKQTKEETQ